MSGRVYGGPRTGARAAACRGWGRRAGLATLTAFVLLACVPRLHAQRVTAGAQYALAQYAEQGAALRFTGGGPAGHVSLQWRRFGLHAAAARLSFEPRERADVTDAFEATQVDLRLRVRATRLVSVEAGFVDRDIEPLHAAQSVASMRLGALIAFPLHVDSELAVRASYLGGSRFSGGGSAPFGVEIGLNVSHALRWRHLRLTGDLEFQRLDRRTDTAGGELAAPIQSAVARIGVMVAY